MARPRQPGLTENELEIIKVLWLEAPLKVAEILERLVRRPPPAYTSLLTVVQSMEKKGYIRHVKEGKAFTYFPVLKEAAYKDREIRRMAKRLFNGGPGSLVLNLVQNEHLTAAEILELKKLLEAK